MLRRALPARALGAAAVAGVLAFAALVPAAGASGDGDLGITAFHHEHDGDHDGPRHPRAPRPGTVGAPVLTGLNAPFGVDVSRHGSVWTAETGTGDDANPAPGQVSVTHHGVKTVLATDAPFITDVTRDGHRDFTYLVNGTMVSVHHGEKRTVDLAAYEAAHNPDQVNTYGPRFDLEGAAGPACWATVDPELQAMGSSSPGDVNSNPFRTVRLPDGSRAVADAGGNDVLRVDEHGNISVLAVLPPNVVHTTAADLSGPLTDSGAAFPQCVLDAIPAAGFDYAFNPVPTGLAVGWDLGLYVGLLPGGEIPGAGKIMRIDLRTGEVSPFVSGLSNVTDIVFGDGVLYATELFTGDIVQIPVYCRNGRYTPGPTSTFATVPMPNGLAFDSKHHIVYASINSLTPAGQVVPITP